MEFLKKLFLPITATLGFIQKYFKSMIFLLILFWVFSATAPDTMNRPNLMKIHLAGPIFDSESFLEDIQEAEEKHIKGVLLVVDSPGGSVPPSIEMALAIKRLKAKKPVIAYASGIMASGSYYASIYADKIIANPGAMIGSIGVIMQGMDISEIMEKVGFKEQTVSVGKYKQMGTATREWNEDEKEELNRLIHDTYEMFVSDVANARGLDINKSSEYADAHVFSASRAKSVGLVDEVGSIYEATQALQEVTGVKKPIWKSKDKMDKILDQIAQKGSVAIFSYFNGLKAY